MLLYFIFYFVDRGNDTRKRRRNKRDWRSCHCEFGKMIVMLRIGYMVNLFILLTWLCMTDFCIQILSSRISAVLKLVDIIALYCMYWLDYCILLSVWINCLSMWLYSLINHRVLICKFDLALHQLYSYLYLLVLKCKQ